MKRGTTTLGTIWQKDWLVGLVVSVVLMLLAGSDLIQSLERKAYDLGVQASVHQPSDRIAIIAIDDASIANLGRWPWPREIQARMIDLLNAAGAQVIGNTVLFTEPQNDAGLNYVRKISAWLDASGLRRTASPAELDKLEALLAEATRNLNNDLKLAEALSRARNVLLALYFESGEPQGKPAKPLPDFVQRNQLNLGAVANPAELKAQPARDVAIPIPELGQPALALGHVNFARDLDGAVRREALAIDYYGALYPSFALQLAAHSLNLKVGDIQVQPGGVQLGKARLVTDDTLHLMPYFYPEQGGRPAFQVDSFYDVLSGKIAASKYRDKVVLIGSTASGVGTLQVTPVSANMPSVVTLAHIVSSILQGHYYVSPTWAVFVPLVIVVLVALYLIFLLPRLRAAHGALLTGSLFLLMVGTQYTLMLRQALWLPLMLPLTVLLLVHLLLTTKRFLVTEQHKDKSLAESAESNRQLGLTLQGQGALDMAFEKFRKVPMDDSLMELMYNLGLDFERKRQFNKAESVFRYMADYQRNFRDLQTRLAQNKQLSEAVLLGGPGRGNDSTLALKNTILSKPMLGRYEVERELGKGAMGTVYLGRDSKIGRQVAIKTLALAHEFNPDVLAEVKRRFFVEAESAGRLNHPNIVTVYDAGEEQDLAYIAMELLKGQDLTSYAQAEKLLPLPLLMGIVAQVADALDYAHRQNVVHRDIKPGNIMYDPERGTVKVTDFGIAQLSDSSKTKSGMVLGSPAYMSPEQISGRKVDGRTDLYSLGVTLYQLACGQLPFDGETLTQLMYHIANDTPKPVLSLRPELPPCLAGIIEQAMAKTPEQRYASGVQMAQALRACAAQLPQTPGAAVVSPANAERKDGERPAWSDTYMSKP